MYLKIRLCFALVSGFATLYAQSPLLERITIEHGLSQGMIFDMVQTRDGFLWIATKDGLNRYDGYNFKIFSNDPFAPYSLAENTVTQLLEDAKGRLWVGLQNKGLDLYDPTTGRFHHFPVDAKRDASRLGGSVEDIVEVPADQSVWVLLSDGTLLRFALPSDWDKGLPNQPHLMQAAAPTFVALPALQNPVQPEKPERFRGLDLRPNGELLVFSEKMYYAVDPITRTGRLETGTKPGKVVLSSALTLWKGRELRWMVRASAEAGPAEALLCRLRDGEEETFPLPTDKWGLWRRLLPGSDGHAWLAIGRGIWHLAPDAHPDFSKPDLTFDAVPTVWMHDRNGNFWSGTIGYGLRKRSHLREVFNAGATDKTLLGVWKHQGRYFARWVNEIRGYDPLTGLLSERRLFPDAPMLHLALAFEPSGGIWLLCASEAKGGKPMLRRYAPGNTTAAVQVFEFDAPVDVRHPLLRTRDGRLWFATHGGLLIRCDPANGQVDYFEPAHLFGEKAAAVRAVALAEAPDGVLWLGTNFGLVKAEATRTGKGLDFQLFQADPTRPEGLNNNSVACLLPTADGLLWIGTKGGGINLLDPRTGHCRHITTAHGLPNSVVYGILPGHRPGEFWCSTNRGLAKISLHPDDGTGGQRFKISAFTPAMGLQDNEFNTGAYFRADDGELLFGGVNGLNRFFPENLQLDDQPPPVYVVGLEINNQKVEQNTPDSPLAAPLEQTIRVELTHRQNNLAFEFAALDFTDPARNRYRYRLEGLDKEWMEVGHRRFAYFNHLPPGRYVFRVQGSNGESAWNEAKPITVVVRPPWWRSPLAWVCYALLFAWLAWRAWRFQVNRLQEREQAAFEHREAERIRALEQMKTNFFSNVTHEFRTPLTLIIEPLRQLLKNPDAPNRRETIRLAEHNSRKLLGLVNQLLDMAKLESGATTLDLRGTDPCIVIREVFEPFLHLAEKRGIHLTLRDAPLRKAAQGTLYLFDAGKVELILNNLVSNALKFTPPGGRVVIQADLRHLMDAAHLHVNVSDTGIGIPEEALDKVFDRFYQVDGSHTRTGEGTGIGLALSKELAELMGGGIRVESELGKGSTFTFSIPVQPDRPAEAAAQAADERIARPKTYVPQGEWPVVLVVEDHADLRAFIKNAIGRAAQVVEASDGDEGLQKAIELLPDLVISDVMMPRKDGYALCHELKTNELTAHIPVILLTAKAALDAKLKGLRSGADDYLTKPFSTEELLTRMDNLMAMRRKLMERWGKRPSDASADAEEGLSVPDWAFLKKLTLLIEMHLSDETLGVEEFAGKMHISRVQLHRKLKAITGITATDFIKNYRLDRAYAMLRNREGLVGEIALRVGFGNEKYFATVFKEKFGLPPSQV
jgi:signal transduction histidine kinase/DNA-binding response OmpR family regulator/ligand-binding sensor domain-containing protein